MKKATPIHVALATLTALVLVISALVSTATASHDAPLNQWIDQGYTDSEGYAEHPAYALHCPDTYEAPYVGQPYTANIDGETVTMSDENVDIWRFSNFGVVWTSGPCQWRQPSLDSSDEFKRTSRVSHPGHECQVEGKELGDCHPGLTNDTPPPPPTSTTTVPVKTPYEKAVNTPVEERTDEQWHDIIDEAPEYSDPELEDISVPAKLCWNNMLVHPDEDCPAEPKPQPVEQLFPDYRPDNDVLCRFSDDHKTMPGQTRAMRQYPGETHAQACAAVGGSPA